MKKFTFSKVAGIQLATLLKNTPVSFKFFVNFLGIPILIDTFGGCFRNGLPMNYIGQFL